MIPVALVTGASGGLGEEFARLLAKDGNHLVIIARNEEKLEALAQELSLQYGIRVYPVTEDLSSNGAIERLMEILKKDDLMVTTLINNAGVGGYGKFHERSYADDAAMIQVNIMALMELTKKLLPQMIDAKEGRILNVASTAAFAPGPLMAVYYASKAFVLSFSEAIRNELQGTGVTVTCLCPGPTKTGFANTAHVEDSPLFRVGVMDAETVARIGYQGMLRGKALVIPGLRNRVTSFCTRLVPLSLAARIARKAQEKSR